MDINTRVMDLQMSASTGVEAQNTFAFMLATSHHEAPFIAPRNLPLLFSHSQRPSHPARSLSTLPTRSNSWLATQFAD